MLELSLLLDCDCSTDEDEVVEVKPFCWFEQAAKRARLDKPVANNNYFFFMIILISFYSATVELTSAL